MPGSEIIDEKEKNAISKLFSESGILVSTGNKSQKRRFYVRELEKKFAHKMKCKFALAVTSGTAAIKIALKSLGVKHGDEVITQSFNFIATIEAISFNSPSTPKRHHKKVNHKKVANPISGTRPM